MAIAVSLRTAHLGVKDVERDGVRPVQYARANAWQPRRVLLLLHLGRGHGELRPDVVAESPITLP